MDARLDQPPPREGAEVMEAAVRLVKRAGPDSLTLEAVAAEAGLPAQALQQAFPTTAHFVLGLHQHYLDTLLRQISGVTATLPPGAARLRAGIARFLDVSLRRARMRAAIRQLKAGIAGVSAQMDQRHRAFSHMLAAELAAMKRPRPIESARLLRAMVEEISRAELAVHKELPELRAALWQFLDGEASARAPASEAPRR